jgi:hypothetical protein
MHFSRKISACHSENELQLPLVTNFVMRYCCFVELAVATDLIYGIMSFHANNFSMSVLFKSAF